MAGELDLSAILRLDASDAVTESKRAADAIGDIDRAQDNVTRSSRELEGASSRASAAMAQEKKQAAETARQMEDLARKQLEAARAAVDAARTRAGSGKIELTAANPVVLLDPFGVGRRNGGGGGGGSTGASDAQTSSNNALAEAVKRAADAEALLTQRSREAAEALRAAQAASASVTAGLDEQARAAAAAAGAQQGANDTTAESSSITEAVADAAESLRAAQEEAAGASDEAGAAARRAAEGQDDQTRAMNLTEREAEQLAAAERTLATATDQQEREAAAATIATLRLANAQREQARRAREAAAEANRAAFGARNLGQQVGDFATQVSLGGGVLRAFSSQIGQVGFAMSEMSGRMGAVGRFLVGPWGVALTVGALIVAPLIDALLEAEDAAKKLELGSSGLADAQGVLGEMFDLQTGKLKKLNAEFEANNELLRVNARLTAINLRAEAAKERLSSQEAFNSVGDIGLGGRLSGFGEGSKRGGFVGAVAGAITGDDRARQNARNLQGVVSDVRAGRVTSEAALRAAEKVDFTGLSVKREDFMKALVDDVSSEAKDQIAKALDETLDTGRLNQGFRREKTSRDKKPKSTAARDEFGADAAAKIASIVDEFDGTPDVIAKTNDKVRELDDLIRNLGVKKPPNFEELIASAERAKTVVREGLIREVSAAYEAPKTLAEKATASAKSLDAVIADLEKRRPPDFEKLIATAQAAKGTIAEALNRPFAEFIEQQTQSLELQRLQGLGRDAEAQALSTIYNLEKARGPLNEAQKAAVLAIFQAMQAQNREAERAQRLQQKYLAVLGDVRTAVEDATQAFVRGDLGQFIKTPGKLLDAFQTLQGQAIFDKLFDGVFQDLQDQVTGTNVVKDASDRMAQAVAAANRSIGSLGDAAANAAARLNGTPMPTGTAGGVGTGEGGEIVVTASRSPEQVISRALGKVSSSLLAVFTNREAADRIGSSIGKFAGKGLEGAATGSIVSGVGKALGVGLSGTGAQLGGALGNLLPIPGGSIIGSLAGGLLGGLFGKKARPGGATVSMVGGEAGISGTVGRDKNGIAIGNDLGGSVAAGINQIAEQLGASVGSFNVAIGKYKDDLRVNVGGRALGGVKNSGATGFGDDQAAAVSYAISLAISQGAVQGLSEAERKALGSSSDVDKALREALAVKNLEQTLGGLGSSLKAVFDAEDTAAKERVRLARTYGLDIVATEKLNAEQRTKLIEQTLQARIGSLTEFLNQTKFGDLFEGDASERRTALQSEIAKVLPQAEAGIEGAADTLQQLYQQLLTTSRDAFGTAGDEYASDRSSAISEVEKVIRLEQDRVAQAANLTAEQTAAIKQGVALQNETNDLLARQNTILGGLTEAVERGYTGQSAPSYNASGRRTQLV